MAVKKGISAKKEKEYAEAMMAAMARDNVGNVRAGKRKTTTNKKKK
jgi:hypothetical protein